MAIDFTDAVGSSTGYRGCYVRGDRLAKAFEDETVLDAVIAYLKPPGKAVAMRGLTKEAKALLVEEQLTYLRSFSTSEWKGQRLAAIWAAHLFKAKISDGLRATLFAPVAVEEDLAGPVDGWLRRQDLAPHREVSMGNKRTDVLGYLPKRYLGLMSERIVSVELKNELSELDRGFAQLSTYRLYSTRTYLAVTPDFLLRLLWQHINGPSVLSWDTTILEKKLKPLGAGLLLVEGTEITVVLDADDVEPSEAMRHEVRSTLQRIQSAGPPPQSPPA